MTLVVARVTALGIRIAADMRVTDRHAAHPPSFVSGSLKVVLLRPTLCIAYAGTVEAALTAIRGVASDLRTEDAISHLFQAHPRLDQKVEFLVASLRPSALVAIKDGRVESRKADWLGSRDAYAEYQRYYLDEGQFLAPRDFYESDESYDDMDIAARMSNGMNAVVHGPGITIEGETRNVTIPQGGSHETGGEEIIYVVPRAEDNLFNYSHQSRAHAPFDLSAAAGGFSYAVLTPEEPGIAMIGLYLDQGELGVLHAPLLTSAPLLVRGVTRREFVEEVRARHGVSLTGFGL